jgi:xanthine dehydrogenase small subunit
MLELMINADVVKVTQAKADTMLLNYLREEQHLCGTKEGCASGDCGACTVVMVDCDENDQLCYRQINSCITPIHSLHGKQIITVEYLKQGNQLHPVQQLVADKHGTQCGFCTPGIVMSLYALSKQAQAPEHPTDYLAGNLCRCTGYGPLIEAANIIAAHPINDPLATQEARVLAWMQSVAPLASPNYLRPTTRSELMQVKTEFPNARLIAGGTDLALEVTQQHRSLDQLIDLSNVDDLLGITAIDNGWRIGAATPMHQMHQFMKHFFPSTDELIERLGSLTIRHRATIGGSLGHASPIGDIAPLLISLNGRIEVDNGRERILYSPEEYIVDYRKTLIKPDQWISAIHIPHLETNQKHAIYKISKRYEDDIATVVLALNMTFDDKQNISHCIISAGGVAAKSVRLEQLEQVFLNHPLSQSVLDQAKALVPQVLHPLSDVRGSAEYRLTLVQNLMQRYYYEMQQVATRLVHHA